MKTTSAQLASLEASPDFRVCADDTDPRGWRVVDSKNAPVGDVSDLIIDLEGLTVRYVVCSVTRGGARTVLIPMGFARFAQEQSIVRLDFLTEGEIEQLPTFEGLPLSAEHLARIEKVLTGETPAAPKAAKIVRRRDVTPDAS